MKHRPPIPLHIFISADNTPKFLGYQNNQKTISTDYMPRVQQKKKLSNNDKPSIREKIQAIRPTMRPET